MTTISPTTSVGSRIRKARRDHGWTQDELANAVGVSRSAVAQWETDRAGQLRDNLTSIAAALGLPVAELVDGNLHVEDRATRTGDELALLRLYRECEPEDRAFLLRTARKLAASADLPTR